MIKIKKTTRFILINLEREKGQYFHHGYLDTFDKFNEDTNLRVWEIEHILPQTLNNEWKKILSPDDMSQAEKIKNDSLHLLGNLTLTPYNKGLSNRSFKNKVVYTDGDNLVGLNLNLHLNNSINKGSGVWNQTSILDRNEILTEEFLEKFKIE